MGGIFHEDRLQGPKGQTQKMQTGQDNLANTANNGRDKPLQQAGRWQYLGTQMCLA
jgi:hypothetical protein